MRLFLLSTSITVFTASAAFAADMGQYRPGNPYQSVMSPSADICESHCSGDAQCRSWNYIKVNARASGVCEFNTEDVSPVPSAISISGTNVANTYQAGVVSGSTNTIKVGNSVTTQGQRRIVREPVPEQHRAQTASTRPVTRPTGNQAPSGSLTAQQNQYRNGAMPRPSQNYGARPQQFRHDLGGRPLQATPPNAAPQAGMRPQYGTPYARQPQRVAPYGAPQRPQASALPPQQRSQRLQNGYAGNQPYPPQNGQAPLVQRPMVQPSNQMRPPKQAAAMTRRSANDPITYGFDPRAQQGQAPVNGMAQQNMAYGGLTAQQAQQSLFGKLNDDVRRPNSGSPVPLDPNAPIPTQASRQTVPVQQGNLGGLAGAPRY